MVGHVRDAVEQIDENSWVIDRRLLLQRCRQSPDPGDHLWRDGNGWCFTIRDAPPSIPPAMPLPPDSFPELIYDVGDASVVFDFGDALLRVKDRHPFRGVTPEPETLGWLADRQLTFAVPKVLHYTEDDDTNRIYFIVSRVPGRSIDQAWRDLNDEQKEQCVTRVAEICLEISTWTSTSITGVDGNFLFDPWLDRGAVSPDLSPANLERNCQQMHMDTSKLVFNHNDLGPTNVMVDINNDCSIGLVDWEMAGFVPFPWVRTKLATCYAMDFCWRDVDCDDASMREWRERLAEKLGEYHIPCMDKEHRSWLDVRQKT